jgi:dipeptidyl-peptidase-4
MQRTLFCLLLALAPLAAQRKAITLDVVTSRGREGFGGAGSPAAWLPGGQSFLFREEKTLHEFSLATQTAREVLSLEPLEKAAVQVPEPEQFEWENRRLRGAPLELSPDAKRLLLTVRGDLFVYRLDEKRHEQLTRTPVSERDAKLSPDGLKVSFTRGWDLYVIEIASGKETRITRNGREELRNGVLDWVYPEELALGTAHWWSPDSQSLAYLQFDVSAVPRYPHADLLKPRAVFEPQRYPQAGEPNATVRLGVVSAQGGPTRWMNLGDTRDQYLFSRVGWIPGGRELWVQRLTRTQNRLEFLQVNPVSGEGQTLFTESDPAWVNTRGVEPVFLSGGRFLWLSERDRGFQHLYLYSADGRDARQLTRGEFEVTRIEGVDGKNRRVYFTSTEASPLERHLYSIGLDGRNKQRLTTEPGTHAVTMNPEATHYLDRFSSLTQPPRTTLHEAGGREIGVYRAPDVKAQEQYEILPTEIHEVKSASGVTFYARLIKPAGFQPGRRYPAIVMVYGGPGAQNVRNAWAGVTWDQALAHKGYVIWQLDNRGTEGRGHAFETPVARQLGVVELADQVEGVRHLVKMGFVDEKRIGIYGWSYGGFMAINAMLNAPAVFAAGAGGAPVTSWLNYDTIYTERYMGLPADNPEGYEKTALPRAAANLAGKLMIIHCLEDDNVLFQNTLQLTDALQRAGKPFELLLYPHKSHGVTGVHNKQMLESITGFFDRHLQPAAPPAAPSGQ